MITIQDIKNEYKKTFYLEDDFVIDLLMATVLSTYLKCDNIWTLIVGGPSSGKSELINLFFKIKFVHQISDMTENTLLSGMATGDTEASFLNRMGPLGCIAMKDFTSILAMRKEKTAIILGQLREVYDGYIEKKTGNGRNPKWMGKATFIGGVTEAVYNASDESSSMGNRNILYTLPEQDRKKTARMSQKNKADGGKKDRILKLQEMVAEYVDQQVCNMPDTLPLINDELITKLIDLADFSTHARTPTTRDYRGTMTLVPSLEMPMRMLDQLVALAQVFTIMYAGELPESLQKGLFKIALDSIPKQKRLALRDLAKYQTVTTKGLAIDIKYDTETVRKWLQDLNVLALVDRLPPLQAGEPDRWQLKDPYIIIMTTYDGIERLKEDLQLEDDYYGEESEELDPGDILERKDRMVNGNPFAGSGW
jgi:hypothetical protein